MYGLDGYAKGVLYSRDKASAKAEEEREKAEVERANLAAQQTEGESMRSVPEEGDSGEAPHKG